METREVNSLNLKQIIEVLIKHYDIHEGLFDVAFEIQVGIGSFGPTKESTLPGAAIGIGGLKLVRSAKAGLHTVDAAIFNPPTRKATKK